MKRCLCLLPLFALLLIIVPISARKYSFGIIHAESKSPTALNDFIAALTFNYSSSLNPLVTLDAGSFPISLANISNFDAVLVFAHSGFQNATTLGNALSDYIAGGGGVVLAAYSTASFSTPLTLFTPGGTFAQNYQVIIPTQNGAAFPTNEIGAVYWPNHPVVAGVNNLTAGIVGLSNMNVTGGSYVLARNIGGGIVAAAKDGLGPAHVNRVDLVLWPPDAAYNYYGSTTAYDQLIFQALVYTISNAYYTINTGVCVVPDVLSLLNSIYTVPSGVAFTQSVAAGTPIHGSTQVNFTLTLPKSGTIYRLETLTCGSASSVFSHSWLSWLMG